MGRDRALRALTGALGEEPRCVFVRGPAGIGKTRLTAELAARASARRWTVATAVASRSAAAIPFGALAPLLPTDHVLADTPAGLNRRAARAIRDLGGGGPVLLVVDDAHTLDDASAILVHELVGEGAVSVVLTLRDGESLPAPVHQLLDDGDLAVEVALAPLARSDVAELVDVVLDGPVDGAVVHRVWERSGGNPLYVRELVLGGIEAGALRLDDGLWRWSASADLPSPLVDLVSARIGTLDEADGRALAMLAVAGEVGRPDAVALLGAEVVERLLDRGFLVEHEDGRRRPVRLSHPVYEEALRSSTSRARRREVCHQVAERIAGHGARRRGDNLRAVGLLLHAGGSAPVALLEAAAREAYLAYDLDLTERVARAALDAGAGPGLTRVLGEILRWQGRHQEAEALLAAVDPSDVDDDGDVALLAIVRAECLFRGLGRRVEAEAVLERAEGVVDQPVWAAELRAWRAEIAALAGDVDEALAIALPLLADDLHPRASVVAAAAAAPALLAAGRADDAAAIAERALSLALGLGPQPAIAHPALQAIVQSLALAEAGRLGEATPIARTGYEWSLASRFPIGQAWFALALGRCQLVGGRLRDAERLFREAAAGFRDLREDGLRRWALAGVAQSAAARGDLRAAESALSTAGDGSASEVRLAEVELARGRAAAAALAGERSRAVATLVAAAAEARGRGQHGFALGALHDVVRLGAARAVAGDLEALGGVQGPLAAARRAHGAASLAGDRAALVGAADAFAALGADLLASEALAQAATLAGRDGGRADHLAARAADLAATCGAVPPAVARPGPASHHLTSREHEICALAARGLSNAEIAERLGISVRTVGNHLQRAYAKLAVGHRSELAAALGATGT